MRLTIFSKTFAVSSLLAGCAMMLASAYADKEVDMPEIAHNSYKFSFKETPAGIAPFSTVAYPYIKGIVYNPTGGIFASPGNKIFDLDINPAGFNMIALSADTKGRSTARIYSMRHKDRLLHKVDSKLGNPTAATYSPDGLNILLATDKGLYVIDARTYKVVDTMPLAHSVSDMKLSSNGYHLATTDGNKVTVYNFEDKSIRHKWDFEDVVSDIIFSDDNSELAILTTDGLLSIFDTRTYLIKNTVDNLGDGIGASYNSDGKYVAVAQSPTSIAVVNLLEPLTDRELIGVTDQLGDLVFLVDSNDVPMLAFTSLNAMEVKRMLEMQPYYSKLVGDEVDKRMSEWLKMMPGESLEAYQLRVNDETKAAQRRLFEDEAATRLAPDLLSMAQISLGQYDARHGLLEVDFSNMPPIYLPVPEGDITAFTNAEDLTFSNAKYAVDATDKFELIYAEVINRADGKTYIYNNVDRIPLKFMEDDDEGLTIELIQQQQMEEMKLQEVQKEIVEEAKSRNVISDHTDITVATEVVPDYDANGNRILNYKVKFTYEVEPAFTAVEDFAPGKYRAEQSGAASSMLALVKKSLEGELARYVKEGKKVQIKISGTADSSPVRSRIAYDGVYGDFVDEPAVYDGKLTGITVTSKGGITTNEQLAFLRAQGVKQFLQDNIKELNDMKTSYKTEINVAEGKGSQFRRITAELLFVDAL